MAGVDPISLAIIGGVGGAIFNKEDPVKGALLGAGLGFGGASLLGGAAAGATGAGAAGAAGAAGSTYAGAVPGLSATGLGSQAAMLQAQTGVFGLPGLTATGAAAATPGTLSSAAWNLANKAMLPGTSAIKEPLQLARMGLNQGGGTQNRTVYAPPQMRPAQQVDVASGVQGLLNMRDPQDPRRRRMASLSLI